jgi:hypothetical protein
MGEIRNAQNILIVKPAGKRPLGRHWCRYENNIKKNLKNSVRVCTGFSGLGYEPVTTLVNMVINILDP